MSRINDKYMYKRCVGRLKGRLTITLVAEDSN
jgi:hypothetical protein